MYLISMCDMKEYTLWMTMNCPAICGSCIDDHDHKQDHDHEDHDDHDHDGDGKQDH